SITFSGSSDYLLVPTGCSGGGCAEIGTYRLDAASKVLLLENARTHEARSIALEVVKTSDATPSLVKSVKPLDLVDPGDQLTKNGQETTTGGGQQLATGGNATTGAAQQLLQLIKEAIMNGQQMKQDDKGGQPPQAPQAAQAPQAPQPSPMMADPQPDAMAAPMSDCKQGIPTKDTSLAEVAAYFARCPKGP
ncbi:MAG: hypothetical protein QOI41_7334, partial [Myxococcales bacterium]|nr:hypothetical protein [Myxococcales bacterium]